MKDTHDSRVDEVVCMHVCQARRHIQGHAKQSYLTEALVGLQHILEVPLQKRRTVSSYTQIESLSLYMSHHNVLPPSALLW